MRPTRQLVAIGAVLAFTVCQIAFAQTVPDQPNGPMRANHQHMMQSGQHPMGPDEMREMMRQHHGTINQEASTTPMLPGQGAFGAIQEIVQILEANPNTDWSKVDLEGLRRHLIDMNEVTLKADAEPKQINGGLEIAVTGTGRTLLAIQRMVPAWAQAMEGHQGWSTKATTLPNGELLTVTAADPNEVQHIRGLGFIGLLVSGSMHQAHHLAMAKGEFDHEHPGHKH